jgi:hypothetical protein
MKAWNCEGIAPIPIDGVLWSSSWRIALSALFCPRLQNETAPLAPSGQPHPLDIGDGR